MRHELGPMRRDEAVASLTFLVTAILWMSRKGLELGSVSLPGWQELSCVPVGMIDDATVAIAMAILLFCLPSKDRPGERMLEWRMAREVPWGMLLLFGGGFALAEGFGASGLSTWVAGHFSSLEGAPAVVVIGLVCVTLTFLTELTSNTATTQMVLPILASAAVALHMDPRALMIPATLSASCAFMMPVASPTQAIVFSSGRVPIRSMMRAGLWFNALGVFLVVLFFMLFAGPVLGIDPNVVPDWAVLPK
jgi:sodium-dependent dicarboxylate transporter 2/3/5